MSRPTDTFWLCHECHAEMRPIQRSGRPLQCASCESEFIEILDPAVNPPVPEPDAPDHSNFFQSMFSSLLSAAAEPQGRSTRSSGGREFSFNFPGGGRGSVVVGPMGGQAQPQGLDAFFPGFAGPERREDARGQDIFGALFQTLAQDGALPPGMRNPGAMGDYVMTENGFNDVMEQLMHAAGPQGPIPATEAVIEGLPRSKFDKESLDSSVYKDCPVCKDDFVPGDEVVKVPCAHIFHPDCLQPWLKTNGSCPVCRFSLVPDEARPAQEEAPEGQPLLTNILNRLWGQGGAPALPVTEAPTSQTTSTQTSSNQPSTDDPPVPSLSSGIPDDYRARHRQREREREREREEEYPSYFS